MHHVAQSLKHSEIHWYSEIDTPQKGTPGGYLNCYLHELHSDCERCTASVRDLLKLALAEVRRRRRGLHRLRGAPADLRDDSGRFLNVNDRLLNRNSMKIVAGIFLGCTCSVPMMPPEPKSDGDRRHLFTK